MTQFGRALAQLNIDIICANTPQAKGRVERANRTLQDRLVKELRLRGISSLDAANTFVPSFMQDFNARFAKPPRSSHDAHRPLAPGEDLHDVLSLQEQRKVSSDLVVHYKRRRYLIQPSEESRAAAGKKCPVYEWIDGTVELRYEGRSFPYACFGKDWVAPQTPVVPNKLLDGTIEWLKEKQRQQLADGEISGRITQRERKRIRALLEA